MFDKSKFTKETTGNQVVFTYEDKEAFTKGSSLDLKTLKAVEDYKSKYLKSLAEVSSELAKDTMGKNKKIDSISVNVPFSTSERGSARADVFRSKTFTGIKGEGTYTHSKVNIVVKDPYSKVSKKYIKDMETELTSLLVKEND